MQEQSLQCGAQGASLLAQAQDLWKRQEPYIWKEEKGEHPNPKHTERLLLHLELNFPGIFIQRVDEGSFDDILALRREMVQAAKEGAHLLTVYCLFFVIIHCFYKRLQCCQMLD